MRTTLRGQLPLANRGTLAWRLAGVTTLFLGMISVAAAVPYRYAQLLMVSPAADTLAGQLRPEDAGRLAQAGLSVVAYARYFTVAELLTAFVALGVAGLMIWGRSKQRMAVLVAINVVAGAAALPLVPALAAAQPQWAWLAVTWRVVFLGGFVPLFFLFPDGRFVPPWTRWLLAAWLAYTGLWLFVPRLQPPASFGRPLTAAETVPILLTAVCLLVGVLVQIWRYRHVSSAVERQRTRMVVFGFAVMLAFFVAGVITLSYLSAVAVGFAYLVTRLAGPTLILIGFQVSVVSIAFSILRYRLWDIDLLIRRTLIYSALSAVLALAYFSSVLVLENVSRLFTGQGENSLVVVLSTLAIAALFVPLRSRVQRVIDRRFFRQKYDAARTLAGFAAGARDETDLEKLSTRLIDVVDETMQPAQASLWLKPPRQPEKRSSLP